ncbi:MAG: hypothetical protein C4329_11275 [Chitinophagaceae bacterium]
MVAANLMQIIHIRKAKGLLHQVFCGSKTRQINDDTSFCNADLTTVASQSVHRSVMLLNK